MTGREREQAGRASRVDATIDRAGQVLDELLAVAGELEECAGRLTARAGMPRRAPAPGPAPITPPDRRPRRG